MMNEIISVAAIIGAVLGIINTFQAWSQNNRVKIKITFEGGEKRNFHIGILNLSKFPVTIINIGFYCENGKKFLQNILE